MASVSLVAIRNLALHTSGIIASGIIAPRLGVPQTIHSGTNLCASLSPREQIPGESSFLTGDTTFGGRRGPHHTQYTYTTARTVQKFTQTHTTTTHTHILVFDDTEDLLPIGPKLSLQRQPTPTHNDSTLRNHSHAARKIHKSNSGAQWRAKWPLRIEREFSFQESFRE